MWVAAKNNNSLKVLDFGGSLGSTYFQNKQFLNELGHVEWNIVEQENFVTTGREHIQDNILQFFYSIPECIEAKGCPDIIILSCVIPYLEKPYSLLGDLNQYAIPHLLIDNTPFNYQEKNRITIQEIPPHIFNASCPCWFLSYSQVKEKISEKYTIVNEHYNESVIYLDSRHIQYRGLLAKLK
jgi:putative methyltransferase (TIGR04325 family)